MSDMEPWDVSSTIEELEIVDETLKKGGIDSGYAVAVLALCVRVLIFLLRREQWRGMR